VADWPDEPEEPDPESQWDDPEQDLARVPEVDVEIPSPPDTPVGRAKGRLFWAAVVYANVGVAGISVGPMLVGFRGQWLVGGGVFLVGVLALVRTYLIYRDFQSRDWDDGAEGSSDERPRTDDGADAVRE
jgi:hypothetical protein